MERSRDISSLLEQIPCPAFTVRDGIIAEANCEAVGLQLEPGMPVSKLISCGLEDYNTFSQGRLCISVRIGDLRIPASVERTDGYDIFYLESEFSSPQLRTFALVSQVLREPLSGAMTSADLMNADAPDNINLLQLKKNLHQLHRALCNMSDITGYEGKRSAKVESCDLPAFVNEIIAKAAVILAQSGTKLEYKNLCPSLICLADREKLERAVFNLISNAAKFNRPGETIDILLEKRNNRLVFSVTNATDLAVDGIHSDLFYHFRRAPALDPIPSGIGLGLSIVRSVAISHGGTVLFDMPEAGKIRFTLNLPIQRNRDNTLRAPIRYPLDYTGGYDHALTEFSDLLPPDSFE